MESAAANASATGVPTSSIPSGANPFASIHVDLRSTFGMVFIGVFFGAIFLGITTMQTIFYYATYPKDKWFMKLLVAVLWILDTLSLVLTTVSIYTYLVIDFMDPLELIYVHWGMGCEPIVTGLVAFLVHEFLIFRIWTLNKNWTIYVAGLAVFSLLPFSLSFVAGTKTIVGGRHMWSDLVTLGWAATAGDVTTSVLDLVVAGTICYQLYRGRTGFSHTDRMLHLLTIYTIHTGLIPTIISVLDLITYKASPSTLTFELFNIVVSKAYANTFLATLNSRQSIRGWTATANTAPMEYSSGLSGSTTMASAARGDIELSLSPKSLESETYSSIKNKPLPEVIQIRKDTVRM